MRAYFPPQRIARGVVAGLTASAGLAGLSAGLWVSLAALVILEGLAQWVWTEDPRDHAVADAQPR
jgi:hypothetical protein